VGKKEEDRVKWKGEGTIGVLAKNNNAHLALTSVTDPYMQFT